MQVRVTVRSGVPPTAEEPEAVGVAGAAQRQMAQAGAEQQQQQQPQPAGSGRQYAFLLALSNHKTGECNSGLGGWAEEYGLPGG